MLAAFPAFAQQDDGRISLSLSPENPSAGDTVTATLVSQLVDLSSSRISWTYGGTSLGSDTGKTRVTFTVGAVGERKTLSARIAARDGQVFEKSVVVAPANVALVWEASDAYTPPFYKGRALLSSQGYVRVVALPDIRSGGTSLKASSLRFTWKRNDKTNLPASGVGRDVFTFRAGYAGSESVSVEVATLDRSIVATETIVIPVRKPELVFYEDKPLGGVNYEEALPESIVLMNEEITLVGEPYHMSERESSSYVWLLNGARKDGAPGNAARITLRVPRGDAGASLVSLSAKHPRYLLQQATRSLKISFGSL